MKEKLQEIKTLIDDVRYDLTRTRTNVDDETWGLLNKLSKDTSEILITYEDLLKEAYEEYTKKELNNTATNETV